MISAHQSLSTPTAESDTILTNLHRKMQQTEEQY